MSLRCNAQRAVSATVLVPLLWITVWIEPAANARVSNSGVSLESTPVGGPAFSRAVRRTQISASNLKRRKPFGNQPGLLPFSVAPAICLGGNYPLRTARFSREVYKAGIALSRGPPRHDFA